MDTLAARLRNADEADVLRLDGDANKVREAALRAGCALFEADLGEVRDKAAFQAAIAQAIQAPAGFGGNWDALADALGDLSWQPAAGYVLLLHNSGETCGLSAAEYGIATEIFAYTSAYWKSRGLPFWIFFD
jgi:hypothetical protein